MPQIRAEILHPGAAAGPFLVLGQPLSFWGGFDPVSGTIIDHHHPQAGANVTGKILAIPASRGSAGTPAGIAEAVRLGTGPKGLVTIGRDINLVTGFMTAARLYDIKVPVFSVSAADFAGFQTGQKVRLNPDGIISF